MTPLATAEAIGVHAPPAAPVQSVAGKVGVVTLVAADVGLGSVTNDAQVKVADKAAQADATTGTDDAKWMTPLKTAQAIAAHPASAGGLGAPAAQTATTVNLSPTSATVQLLDCTSGDMMVNLPDAGDSTPAGTRFILKRVNAGGNGIDVDAGEANIDGVSSQGFESQYSYKDVVFDGTNWWVISSGGT
jgi:hypothetical protein